MNKVLDCIYSRKTVREFLAAKVEPEKIDAMVRAGMAAPSGMNLQTWEFVVVDDPEVLEKLGGIKAGARMIKEAPLAIVVCGNLNNAGEGYRQDYWFQDCAAASENILLAAHSMDLGAVWTEVYNSNFDLVEKVREILSLPEHVIPLNTIGIGYPKIKNNEQNIKYKEEKIHYNKW